jgi:hypothetical protein
MKIISKTKHKYPLVEVGRKIKNVIDKKQKKIEGNK